MDNHSQDSSTYSARLDVKALSEVKVAGVDDEVRCGYLGAAPSSNKTFPAAYFEEPVV